MTYIDTPDARLAHTCSAHCHDGIHGVLIYAHPRLTAEQLTRDATLQGLVVQSVFPLSDPPAMTSEKSYLGFAPGALEVIPLQARMQRTYTQGWIVLCLNPLHEEERG